MGSSTLQTLWREQTWLCPGGTDNLHVYLTHTEDPGPLLKATSSKPLAVAAVTTEHKQTGIIHKLSETASAGSQRRIMDLGLTPG